MLIYNGSIAFAITGLFLVSAAWATLDSGVLPRWTGWLAHIAAASCLISVPAMFTGPIDGKGFYGFTSTTGKHHFAGVASEECGNFCSCGLHCNPRRRPGPVIA